jgi:hypothetical protein
MRASTIWVSAAALALTACASCSSSSNGNGGGSHDAGGTTVDSGGGVSVMQACAALAKAECTQFSTCTPFTTSVLYGDETTCEQRAVLACMPAIGATGSTLTATQVAQCAQAVTAETCEQFLDNDQPSACSYVGSLAAGAACGTDSQCQSGYCRLAVASTCGTCATRAQAGQTGPDGGPPACVTDADCAATLLCAAGVCAAPAATGAACSAQQPCQRTLACISGKCATPVPVGGTCTSPTDCDGAHGAACNTTTKPNKCVAVGTATSGQPCGVVNMGLTECTGGASCGNVNTMLQGTCHQPAADNGLCGPDIACMAPALCATSARCTLPNPANCH